MKETKEKYPEAGIIDYLYEGSESKGDATIEKFKLWLKDDSKEFGAFVHIEFNTETEEVLDISSACHFPNFVELKNTTHGKLIPQVVF